MGPSKKIKAESLGVNIISEDDFIEMINWISRLPIYNI
jgi:hypothetical protein